MPNYDFKDLSSYDFELLTRDLLQQELEISLESFKSGKDKGIDLRYTSNGSESLIVQCKHYRESGYSALKSTLKNKELPKVIKLNPQRYIIVTSVPLLVDQKDELYNIFSPYCKTPGDIIGNEDLNNLLGKFPDIEKQNYKLWLTSSAVLDRIIHSDVYTRSDFEIESIRERLRYYVQNDSYHKARKMLEKNKVCIIAGSPGIGKTTLAEILTIEYMDKGFQVIKVTQNIQESFKVFNKGKKQLFYYDDFLGQTSLESKFQKNEEQDLIRMIEGIQKSKYSRFILTTREYILNQAKKIYEKIDSYNFDYFKYVIGLGSYTRLIRGKILFNHLYFSELPRDYLKEIVESRAYKGIIKHKNYNPRIIEGMTNRKSITDIEVEEYPRFFIENLENPFRLWKHAFDYHISDASRNLLIVLLLMRGSSYLGTLRQSFNNFHGKMVLKYNLRRTVGDFRDSLKELENSFINIETYSHTHVRFHNPSIKDFLEHKINRDPNWVSDIIEFSSKFYQLDNIWEIAQSKKQIMSELINIKELVLNRIIELFDDGLENEDKRNFSLQNASIAIDMMVRLFPEEVIPFIIKLFDFIKKWTSKNNFDIENLVSLLFQIRKLSNKNLDFPAGFLEKMFGAMIANIDRSCELMGLINFFDIFDEFNNDENISKASDVFDLVLQWETDWVYHDWDPQNYQEFDELIVRMEVISDYLGKSIFNEISELNDYSKQNFEDDYEDYDYEYWKEQQIEKEELENEIDSMFDGLICD